MVFQGPSPSSTPNFGPKRCYMEEIFGLSGDITLLETRGGLSKTRTRSRRSHLGQVDFPAALACLRRDPRLDRCRISQGIASSTPISPSDSFQPHVDMKTAPTKPPSTYHTQWGRAELVYDGPRPFSMDSSSPSSSSIAGAHPDLLEVSSLPYAFHHLIRFSPACAWPENVPSEPTIYLPLASGTRSAGMGWPYPVSHSPDLLAHQHPGSVNELLLANQQTRRISPCACFGRYSTPRSMICALGHGLSLLFAASGKWHENVFACLVAATGALRLAIDWCSPLWTPMHDDNLGTTTTSIEQAKRDSCREYLRPIAYLTNRKPGYGSYQSTRASGPSGVTRK
ncbi:hypothetical protein C8F01DRAFT_1084233 [Mycena amicta]|nr:hypothetical protein C8F01DRAFT_1084233 [Mycena amicta]